MSAKVMELLERRARLVMRAAAQRERLSCCYRQFDKPVAIFGKMLAVVNFIRSPIVATALTFLLVKRRKTRRGWAGWLAQGWRLFRVIRRLRT